MQTPDIRPATPPAFPDSTPRRDVEAGTDSQALSVPKAVDRRGPWAIVSASAANAHQGPEVIFEREPRWVIDLLTRWARSRCMNESLQVWHRTGNKWEGLV